MLHYNFPPFSVGETGRIGTGRREIGHGKLAWRAINSSLPSKEAFPYTFRIVSEITESNGSSSMATVCGASLALMDAGVPIKEPVAGIAMGLIKEGDDFSVLSDILGDEDHLGDMDFKVAGTKDGITSLQMDIKITGITFEIMEQALSQAKEGRIHILGEMNKALSASRADVGKHTPKMEKITVDKKDIAAVIGKGGATIREIVEKSGAKVDVNDEGVVTVAAPDENSRNIAMQMIKDITAKAEMNKIYSGKVMKIMEFGAFVNFLGKQDGLVHISELADKRVAKVAGTKDGITSLQMDIKITGITFEIMEQALKQAKDGRIHILGEMNKALGESRSDVGKHTPKMEQVTVDKKDIAAVIGKGGATIREIVEKSGAKVDVNDEGVVTVAAPDEESRNIAMQMIKDITAKAEMNKIYSGKVMKIMEFGAFVNFLGKQDGLVHISELADKRVAKVTDVVKEGDEVKVKVIGFDRGKVKLSMKQATD